MTGMTTVVAATATSRASRVFHRDNSSREAPSISVAKKASILDRRDGNRTESKKSALSGNC